MARYFPFRAYLHFLFDNFRICPHTLITWFVNTYDYKWAEIIGYFTNFYKPQMGYRSYLKVGLIFFLILILLDDAVSMIITNEIRIANGSHFRSLWLISVSVQLRSNTSAFISINWLTVCECIWPHLGWRKESITAQRVMHTISAIITTANLQTEWIIQRRK